MNKARIVAIALCLAIMVLPSAAIPFFRSTQSDAENRMLADDPWLYDSEEGINSDFSRDFEAWLCDHFAFREDFVRANALLNYRLLHTSVNEDVVAGKGDWLYYVESVPDYTGEGRLTEDELTVITDNLRAMGETLEENGAKLYVAIVPNKSSVYPEYMPDRYPHRGDEGNIALLRDACAELPLTWIDLATPLMEAAEQDLIYCHTDTHWNDLGASLAARVVLEGMGREAADTHVVGSEDFRDGDLARLMGLAGVLEESVPVVVSDAGLSRQDFSQREITAGGDGEGRLLMFRDSFGTAIAPYLCAAYEGAELFWETPFEVWRACDDALILICERNLRAYLLEDPELEPFEESDDAGLFDEDFEDFEDEDFGDDDFEDDDFEDEDFEDGDFEDDGFEEDDTEDFAMIGRDGGGDARGI